jgi:hypothetical protein
MYCLVYKGIFKLNSNLIEMMLKICNFLFVNKTSTSHLVIEMMISRQKNIIISHPRKYDIINYCLPLNCLSNNL